VSNTAEKFDRIAAPRAYQLVAEAIEREIESGRLRAGQPLGTEAELVKQFGVNRSTVREGIRILEQAGWVRRDSSRRLLVGFRHYNRLASRMSRALVLREVTFRELLEASLALEVSIVEQAALRATPEVLVLLEANIASSEAAAGNWGEVSDLDCQWHGLLYRAAGNRVLELAREPAVLLNLPATEMILARVQRAMPRLLLAHRKITDAIRRRDVANARLWMRRHLEDWRRGFEHAGKSLDEPVQSIQQHSF
jgi:GntR family transcriptional regulator, transcriptional repressor for pyruvate dehydrogenase complex